LSGDAPAVNYSWLTVINVQGGVLTTPLRKFLGGSAEMVFHDAPRTLKGRRKKATMKIGHSLFDQHEPWHGQMSSSWKTVRFGIESGLKFEATITPKGKKSPRIHVTFILADWYLMQSCEEIIGGGVRYGGLTTRLI